MEETYFVIFEEGGVRTPLVDERGRLVMFASPEEAAEYAAYGHSGTVKYFNVFDEGSSSCFGANVAALKEQ